MGRLAVDNEGGLVIGVGTPDNGVGGPGRVLAGGEPLLVATLARRR
jgi:hypothetical protein